MDTALLFAPKLHAQMLRNPTVFELGPTLGRGVQLRFGASWSPLDALRGARLLDGTRADCHLHQVVERGERAASLSPEALLVDAYAAQAAALESTREEREVLLRQAEARLDDHLITVVAFHELRQLAYALARKQEEARGAVERARAQGVERPPEGIETLRRDYERSSAAFERKAGALRALDPWTVRLTGGVIPSPNGADAIDAYGWIELGYSLGGLVRGARERRYQTARAAEVHAAQTELPARVDMVVRQIAQRAAQARRELDLVERQLALLAKTLRDLENTTSSDLAHVRDRLVLERMLGEADRAFLLALMNSLTNAEQSP